MKDIKKDCNHCVYIRPRKDNLCIILKSRITDIYNLYCDNFKVDFHMQKLEEAMNKNEDEGSKRFFWIFNYLFKPIYI